MAWKFILKTVESKFQTNTLRVRNIIAVTIKLTARDQFVQLRS